MSDHTPQTGGTPGLATAFRNMPKWKVGLLAVSLVVGVLGAGAYLTARANRPSPQTITVQVPGHGGGGVPGGGSGFVGGGGATEGQPQTVTTTTAPPPTLTEQYTPLVAKVGFSFFVGLIGGTISRVFLKLAALVAVVAVGGVAAAHYFGINLDVAGVQAQTGQATTYIHAQLDQLWAAVKDHLPSAGAAGAGFLFGIKRR